jgi:hypothetical protein
MELQRAPTAEADFTGLVVRLRIERVFGLVAVAAGRP